MTEANQTAEKAPRRMTLAEAEAVLTLVRGGLLRLEITLHNEKARDA